jgi:hypothetical protein
MGRYEGGVVEVSFKRQTRREEAHEARSYNAFVARLEAIKIRTKIEQRALAVHVTLRELYEGPNRAPSIVAARRAVYLWLMEEGKGINEIARLFDRAPNGVWKMTRGKP